MAENKYKLNEQLFNVIRDEKSPLEMKLKKAKYLVRLGADVNAHLFGKSILSWAKKDENVGAEVIAFLEENGATEWEILWMEAVDLKRELWNCLVYSDVVNMDEIKNLIRKGANPGEADYNEDRSWGYQIWYYLKFDEMNEILKMLPKGYVIDGNVDLKGRKFEHLPDFSRVAVKGDFECCSNQLTTLKGAPKEVGGDFYCLNNKLETLKGAPKEVGGDFVCSRNQLINLEGAPEKVGKNFCCSGNKLKTLRGKPQIIEGKFLIEDDIRRRIFGKAVGDFFTNMFKTNEGR